jgi:error-prone DNA polymerase
MRLGLRQVKGLAEAEARALVAGRGSPRINPRIKSEDGGYADPHALWRRGALGSKALEALARADAFRSLGLDRREALWAVKGLPVGARSADALPLFAAARARGCAVEEQGPEPAVTLPPMRLSEHVVDDYASLRLSLKAHPLSFLRPGLTADGMVAAVRLATWPDGTSLIVAGLVLVRQRPGTASGVIFATLEDETGVANVIIWPKVFARYRPAVLKARLLAVAGPLQREGLVIHVIARRLIDLSPRLLTLTGAELTAAPQARQLYPSRDFH